MYDCTYEREGVSGVVSMEGRRTGDIRRKREARWVEGA